MKSAYELAMERLEKEDPSGGGISIEKKKRLNEIDETYRAKIAEREVFLSGKIKSARSSGNREDQASLEREMREEKIRLTEECESKKQSIRDE